MMYSVAPRSKVITRIPGVPFGRVPPNYLHDNMAETLARQDVEFDLLVQVQTDPHLMPIENASVRWPEKLSPFIPAATVRVPRQRIDTPAHTAFAKVLSSIPGTACPSTVRSATRAAHGGRCLSLSHLRQDRNRTPHIEPTGRSLTPSIPVITRCTATRRSPSHFITGWRLPRRCAPNVKPVHFRRHFHRDGHPCPGRRRGALRYRWPDKPAHDNAGWFHPGGLSRWPM